MWFSDEPLDANEGAFGDVLLKMDVNLPDEQIGLYEWIKEGKGFREFLIPADVVNTHTNGLAVEEEHAA